MCSPKMDTELQSWNLFTNDRETDSRAVTEAVTHYMIQINKCDIIAK